MPKYLTHITLWKYILTLTTDFQAIHHWARTSYRNNTISTKHTQTQTFNGPLSGTTQVGWYQKKQSPTPIHPDHQTSFINFLHLLRSIHPPCSMYVLDSPFPRPLSRSSLVFLLVWDLLLQLWPKALYKCNYYYFLSIQARSHFRETYCFAQNCCTTVLSKSMIHPYW